MIRIKVTCFLGILFSLSPELGGADVTSSSRGSVDVYEVAIAPKTPTTDTEGADTAAVLPRDLMPLKTGHVWRYKITKSPAKHPCKNVSTSTEVVEESKQNGHLVFKVRSFCPLGHFYEGPYDYFYFQGNHVNNWHGLWKNWIRWLDAPVKAGHQWHYGVKPNPASVWEKVDSITVPAGTFYDCWKKKLVTTRIHYQIYCPGVGEVKRFLPTGFEAELESFKLAP
ncbi:hypothetical protein K2X33_10745 [bacterium]|nr:hypothetical protein [bacterium]